MSRGTLWIGDIEPYMDEAFLKQAFASMGEMCFSAKIIANKLTGLPVGYGFLEFIDEATAQRVLHHCDGKPIPGSNPEKRFKLNHACHSKDQTPQKEYSIFVGELTPEVDDLALYTAFNHRYPSVRAGKVVLDDRGVSRGYGFVRFSDEDEYHAALRDMNGTTGLGGKPIRVSIATPKRNTATTAMSGQPPASQQQDYRNMYQNYQNYNYQNYYNSWQNYQQYYQNYPGYQGYPGYPGYYGQQADYSQQQPDAPQQPSYDQYNAVQAEQPQPQLPPPPLPQDQQPQPQYAAPDPESEFEDHEFTLDVKTRNELAIARNEEFYLALDSSRWLPTEGLDPPLVPVK